MEHAYPVEVVGLGLLLREQGFFYLFFLESINVLYYDVERFLFGQQFPINRCKEGMFLKFVKLTQLPACYRVRLE